MFINKIIIFFLAACLCFKWFAQFSGIDVHVDVEHGGKRMCRGRSQGRGMGRGFCPGAGQMRFRSCPAKAADNESPKRKTPAKSQAEPEKTKPKASETAPMVGSDPAEKSDDLIDLTKSTEGTPDVVMEAVTEGDEMTEEIRSKTEQIVLTDEQQQQQFEGMIREVETAPKKPVHVVCEVFVISFCLRT